MKHVLFRVILTGVISVLLCFQIQAQTSPVTVTTMLGYPGSMYLPEYYSAGSTKLSANLLLNDFNEPSRDVYLIISIESQDLKIQTKTDYITAAPITLYPGQLVVYSGSDLEEYLNYNNTTIEGMTSTQLISRGGRLPEGLYTFCIEAYDFTTRRLLSNSSCQISYLTQNEPPTLLFPEANSVIAPDGGQNITFQWLNNAPLDPTTLSYTFTLYELIDSDADPLQAIDNNQAIVVYEEEVQSPIFNYNSAHPLLEEGKTYIYRVQAFTEDGRDIFKNDGISEPSYFHFGYPGDGVITQISPENNGALELTLEKVFSWSAPDNLMTGQLYNYEIKIAEVDSLRTWEEVLEDDSLLYSYVTGTTTGSTNYYLNVDSYFPTGQNFVWQVKAFTGDQEIAASAIQKFGGPPCILDFIAADHYVSVKYTDGCVLSNISGNGEVEIDAEENTHSVIFNNINIAKEGVQYYLQTGEVLADASDMDPIRLSPEYERNGEAWFFPDSIKLTRYDYLLKGHVEWTFPHAVDQDSVPIIKTVSDWVIFEDFKLIGSLPLLDSTSFDLLDPMNFTIEFTDDSKIYMRGDNDYFLGFNGNIKFPEKVTDLEENSIVVPFTNHEQLFNIESNSNENYSKIKVADYTTLTIQPKTFVFDLDDDASPLMFESDPMWHGFYINEGKYEFEGDYDYSKQFASDEEIAVTYNFDESDSTYAYCVNDGLWAKTKIDFGEDNHMYFNTFPALIDEFKVDIQASKTVSGYINGSISIPLLDDDDNFEFTAELNALGLMTGYLLEDLENQTFEYNADSDEEKLLLTFTRGYFADNERLETTVTIEWPYLDITFEDIPMFRIWGNYDIGFGSANAAFSLSEQMQTILKGYEMTIDGIGAGREGNAYAIGTSAKMVMAEDASGDDGPPVINFYSIFESSKIDENYVLSNSDEYENIDLSENSDLVSGDNSIGEVIEGYVSIGDAEEMMATYQQEMEDAEAQAQALIPTQTVGVVTSTDNLEEDLADYIPSEEDSVDSSDATSTLTYQDIIDIIDYIAPFLEEEQQEKILDFKELLVSFSPDEIESVIEKFSDIRTLLNDLIEAQITAQITKVTKPLKDKVDGLNNKIDTAITRGTNTLLEEMEYLIDEPIDGFADIALKLINGSSIENKTALINGVNSAATSAKTQLKKELNRTVTSSVRDNIIKEAKGIVDTILYTGTILYLTESLASNAADLVTNKDFTFSDIDIDFDGMVDNNVAMLEKKITFAYFSDRISATINDAVCEFDWDNVENGIINDLVGGTIETFIEDKITDAVTDALGENVGGVVGGLAANVSMDFSNIGEKLKNGDLSGIIKFDPTKIIIITPVVDMEGYVKFYEDDPTWGDSFQAELNATIKKPIKLNAFAKFINGTKPTVDVSSMTEEEISRVSTYKFWFFEAGVHGFSIPMTPIPLAITGFEGKIYHHMGRQEDRVTYYPDDSVRFGIGADIFLIDVGSAGEIVQMDVGMELELLTGGYELSMDGDAAIANVEISASSGGSSSSDASSDDSKKMSLSLSRSIVLADGFMSYNSIEKHFLANMNVSLNTSPVLCAGGTMTIDISKDWWQFAIGTREEPIFIALACKDSIFKGWFDINKAGLDIGLLTQLSLDLRSPWVSLGVAKFQGWFVFDLDFQAELVVYWKPSFTIAKGLIYLEFYTGVGVDYKTPPLYNKTKTFTIAAVNLGGELEFATIPESYLKGEVHGSITVLNVKAGLSLEADISF